MISARAPVGVTLLAASAIAASCSSTTSGAPVPQRSTSLSSTSPSNPSKSLAAPPQTAAVSDENQIRETVMAFQDALNTQNWQAYLDLMCAPMRAKFTGIVMDYLKKDRARTGVTTATITSVSIAGDTATVTMDSNNEAMGSASVSLPLKREDDGWKICQT
ncbi:nuclear transport factor 2 family protein [Mycobacterium heckeshornense]